MLGGINSQFIVSAVYLQSYSRRNRFYYIVVDFDPWQGNFSDLLVENNRIYGGFAETVSPGLLVMSSSPADISLARLLSNSTEMTLSVSETRLQSSRSGWASVHSYGGESKSNCKLGLSERS